MIYSKKLIKFKNITHGFFNREGGFSKGIYKSLNCGLGSEDKIEVVGDYKAVHVRTATVIKKDGVEVTRSFHRHVVQPTDDTSKQSDEVKAFCNVS